MIDERKPLWPWIATLLIGLPVLYLASFGPACWLNERGVLGAAAVSAIYSPVLATAENGRLPKALDWYARLGATPDDFPFVFDKTITWTRAWPNLERRRMKHSYTYYSGTRDR